MHRVSVRALSGSSHNAADPTVIASVHVAFGCTLLVGHRPWVLFLLAMLVLDVSRLVTSVITMVHLTNHAHSPTAPTPGDDEQDDVPPDTDSDEDENSGEEELEAFGKGQSPPCTTMLRLSFEVSFGGFEKARLLCVCVCVSAHVYALAFLFAHVLHSLFFGVVVHMLRFASSHRPSSSDTSQRSDGRTNNARHRCVEHEAKELPEHAGGPSGRPSRPA